LKPQAKAVPHIEEASRSMKQDDDLRGSQPAADGDVAYDVAESSCGEGDLLTSGASEDQSLKYSERMRRWSEKKEQWALLDLETATWNSEARGWNSEAQAVSCTVTQAGTAERAKKDSVCPLNT
jgi:hypothetical protein